MTSTMNSQQTIIIRQLSIGYRLHTRQQKVVSENMNASLLTGQMTCLIGTNGAGKSTLMRTLAGFQKPLAGEVLLQGRNMNEYDDRELARLIGVVLTERVDVNNMTVTEMVALGRSPYTGFWGRLNDEDRQIVADSIRLVGITHLAGRMIQTLSDGERQKVMIAKALAQQTPVILLDEPTAFLDYPSKVEVMQLLKRLSREADKTILLSTHDLELALQMADTLWLMASDGQLHIGSPHDLASQGHLSQLIERDGIIFDRNQLTIKVS